MAEELREKAVLYEAQIQGYKEDFENEQRDHNLTRSQLDSQKTQWVTIYKALQEKTQQVSCYTGLKGQDSERRGDTRDSYVMEGGRRDRRDNRRGTRGRKDTGRRDKM